MRSARITATVVASFLFLLSISTLAQNPSASSSANEVHIPVFITDERGLPVENVSPGDISVWEDKKPITSRVTVVPAKDSPLYIAVLFDVSGSQQRSSSFQPTVRAAAAFINHALKTDVDRIAVVSFSDLMTPLTWMDRLQLSHTSINLKSGGGTALYDAIAEATSFQSRTPENTRRVVVLITDGEDDASHITHENALERAQRARVVLFSVSTAEAGTSGRGNLRLRQFADGTGGLAFFPSKQVTPADAFSAIGQQITGLYVLTYTSDAAAPKKKDQGHEIEIKAATQGWRIRTSKRRF